MTPIASSARLRTLFEQAGATFVELPVLHPADPFLETAGEDIRRRMFVTEGPAGERLALRPDFTIPVCLAHLANGAAPARYAYEGVVFRRHDSGAPERPETGFEDIGNADRPQADAEALALAVAACAEIASTPLVVRLGDIRLFAALLAALGLPEPWRRRLRRSFGAPSLMAANLARLSAPRGGEDAHLNADLRAAADAHDRDRLIALLEERLAAHGLGESGGRSAAEIAERFLDRRSLAEAQIDPAALATLEAYLKLEAELSEATLALAAFATERGVDLAEALAEFSARETAIQKFAPAAEIRFEARFGRPLDYYTGLVFDIRSAAHAVPIAGGGRYDRLLEMLGAPAPVPAVGFTMRLDLVAESAP
jgi:ATP phosphoribosyltransferase regulatory subunit